MPGWWCGPTDTKAVDHSTLTPCTAETVGSPVMLLIAATVLYVQFNRVRLLKRHRSYLGLGNYGILEAFVAAVLVALTVSHVGWLIFYLVQRQAAYHYLYEAVMATYWAAALVRSNLPLLAAPHLCPLQQHIARAMQAVVWQGRQHSVSVHLKFLIWPAAIVYIWALYTAVQIYLGKWDVQSSFERIVLLATTCFQALLASSAAVTETLK